MSNIQAGVISDLAKKLPDGFKSIIDDLFSFEGVKSKNTKIFPDGSGFMYDLSTPEGTLVRVKILQSAGYKNFFDVFCLGKDGKKAKFNHLSSENIPDTVAEFVVEAYGETLNLEDVSMDNISRNPSTTDGFDIEKTFSNKKIHISLSKIEGSDEIQITSIYSNYDPMSVYDDISSILDEPEFTSTLGYEPTSYEIIPSEDSYEVNEIDELVSTFYKIDEILAACYALAIRLDSLYAESKLTNSEELNSILNYKELVQNEIQSFLDLASPQDINFENISTLLSSLVFSYMGSTLDELINQHAAILELYKVNLPESMQVMIDEWINSLTYSNFM